MAHDPLIAAKDYGLWLGSLLKSKDLKSVPLPNKICTDSRSIEPGQWFLPLPGANFNGHDFIEKSLQKGAHGFFCEPSYFEKLDSQTKELAIVVEDCLKTLTAIAKGWRAAQKNLTLIAITGSVGKTTCKEMCAHILSKHGKTHKTAKNLNNELGVPLTLLGLNSDDKFAVLEIGARNPGDIGVLMPIVAPNIAICLNAQDIHLEIFGSIQELRRTKAQIISESPDACIGIANGDDEELLDLCLRSGRKCLQFSKNAKSCAVSYEKVTLKEDATLAFFINYQNEKVQIELKNAHLAYAVNWTAACTMALALGFSLKDCQEAAKTFLGGFDRFVYHHLENMLVIDDAYNAAPKSMESGLTTVSILYQKQKKTLILGEMAELGPDSAKMHYALGQFCQNATQPDFLVTVGSEASEIARGALAAGLAATKTQHYDNVEALLLDKCAWLPTEGVLFVKASNRVGLKKFVQKLIAQNKEV